MAAIAGIAILATSVIGIWGYLAAKRSIDQELIVAMAVVGGIVEAQVTSELRGVGLQLGRFAASVAPMIGKATPADLRERLRAIQDFDRQFLHLRILDGDGKLIVANDDDLK